MIGNKTISIAVDGPAGAGKSTIAKKIANKLNIEYIDTGAMYRALTLKVLNLGLNPEDEGQVLSILDDTKIDFNNNSIFLDDVCVDDEIRENTISKNVSYIAKIEKVRERLVEMQQVISKSKSVIMDGRDIGTVVLRDADFKFYLIASVDERANRRYKELLEKGTEDSISLQAIKLEIERRDYIDSNREISPLKKADDAIEIDTTALTIEESVDSIISVIEGGI